jgi:ubiquinone/menaquinone biosynthesis C-methylase UbiE
MAAPAERLRWTVDQLDLDPHDRVLEVGCGHGVMVTLLAERLTNGHVTALDRSPTMVAAAEARNEEAVRAGRVAAVCGSFGAVRLDASDVDHVLAVNVAAFARQPEVCLRETARVLRPGGRLWWAFQTPGGAPDRLVDALTAALRDARFQEVEERQHQLRDGSSITLVVARRPDLGDELSPAS